MTSNSDNKNIMSVVLLSQLLIFESIQLTALVNIMLFLKSHFEHFEKEMEKSPPLWALATLKWYKA